MRIFHSPRGEAATEFERLNDAARDLAARVADVDRQRADAVRQAHEASAALTALERRRAGGEDVDDATRRKAEKLLTAARTKADEPWAERIGGARAAARQADGEARGYAAANYESLASELAEDAQAVAASVDDALRAVMAARIEREAVGRRGDALIALAAQRSRPGLIPYTRIDQAARECERVLMEGGEPAPAPPETLRPANAEAPEAVV